MDLNIRPLGAIQVLRALAALGVVVYHMQGELAHRGFDDPFPSLAIGAFGVDLFFVISGFIMVYSSARSFARPGAGRRFLAKRIVRIAPLYWIFTSLSAVIAVLLARYPGHADYSFKHILASYLFIPAPRPEDGAMLPTLPTGWTLNYEMFFYVCFAVALQWSRPIAVAAVGLALTTMVIVGALAALPEPVAFLANSMTIEFCLGMLLAQLFLAGWRLPLWARLVLIALGAAYAMLGAAHGETSPIRGIAWGVPAAAIVGAAALANASPRGLAARALETLGDASYSLYLVHTALFVAIYVVLARFADPHALSSIAYAFGVVTASIGSALALHAWVERPMTRFLNGALDARGRRTERA
jgi:exopolysaccharide production protein ExoZ